MIDNHYQLLLCTMLIIVLDLVSGILKAAKKHSLKSGKLREGLYHKGAYVLAIALAYAIELACNYFDLGFTLPLVTPALCYISLTDVTSVLENVGEINPDLAATSFLQIFASTKGGKE